MHGRNRKRAGQPLHSYLHRCTFPDMPDCSPADTTESKQAEKRHTNRSWFFFFMCALKKRLEATSALLMNCSVAAFSFSLCPLQALSADACRARPKENVRSQGLGRGQLLMALRWIEASSSLWPPDRKAMPVDENMNLFCLVSAHVSVSKPLNESIILTYLSQLGELCGAEQWGLPLQPPLGCIWWSSCVQELPCWVWAECLRGTRGGLTWPCTLQPGPATQTLFY